MKLFTKDGNMICSYFYIPAAIRHQSLDRLDVGTRRTRTESTLPERKPVCPSHFNIHLTKSELCPVYLGWVESAKDGHTGGVRAASLTPVLQVRPVVLVLRSSPADLLVCSVFSRAIQAAEGSRRLHAGTGRLERPTVCALWQQPKGEPYLVAAGGGRRRRGG